MTGYDFIFSDKPVKRLYRHVLFWAVVASHFIIQNIMIGGFNEGLRQRSFAESAFYALFFLPVYIVCAYVLVYRLIPFYFLRRRYILFFCGIAGLIIISCVTCTVSGAVYMHIAWQIPFNAITFNTDKYNTIVNGLFLPITILSITGGIAIAKNWYFEQRENERLAKEKITRELQLIKTQLHPRFLFYALHSIKSNIQLHPRLAAGLILQLSDLLSYLLYESDGECVSLEKEIDIIKSYADLQNKSRGGKLDMEISVLGIATGKYVSPTLLLSFIENVFDITLKESTQNLSLKLLITVWDTQLEYSLACSQLPNPLEVKEQFADLEKQLDFVYPGTHQFAIESNEEEITINIRLPLYTSHSHEESLIKEALHELL